MFNTKLFHFCGVLNFNSAAFVRLIHSGQCTFTHDDFVERLELPVGEDRLRMEVVHLEFVAEADEESLKVDSVTLLEAIEHHFVLVIHLTGDREDQISKHG